MKRSQVFIFLVTVIVFYSCRKDITGSGNVITETRLTGEFNAVKSEGDFQVFIVKDGSTSVELIGEDNIVNKINTTVSNGRLTIEYASNVHAHRNKRVMITVRTPSIDKIQLNGSGSIQSPDLWTGPFFWLELNGSGDAGFKASAEELRIDVNGSGNAVASGSANTGSLTLRGSGNISAFPLKINDATADKEGSGKIEVYASDQLNVKLNGSGNIYYKGDPVVNAAISGSGKLIKSN